MSSLVYLLVWSPPPHIPYRINKRNTFNNFEHLHISCKFHSNMFWQHSELANRTEHFSLSLDKQQVILEMNLSSQSTALVLTIKYITTNNQLQVVIVIWHKTASPPQMDGSIIFAMWAHRRHLANTTELVLPMGGALLSITNKMFLCNNIFGFCLTELVFQCYSRLVQLCQSQTYWILESSIFYRPVVTKRHQNSEVKSKH